jgi:hypothetical protein
VSEPCFTCRCQQCPLFLCRLTSLLTTVPLFCKLFTELNFRLRTRVEVLDWISLSNSRRLSLLNWIPSKVKVKVKVLLRQTVRPGVMHPSGTRDQFCPFSLWLFLDNCGFADVGRPLWREVGSVVFSFWGYRQRSVSQIWVPRDSRAYFIVSIFETPSTWRARLLYLFHPGTR